MLSNQLQKPNSYKICKWISKSLTQSKSILCGSWSLPPRDHHPFIILRICIFEVWGEGLFLLCFKTWLNHATRNWAITKFLKPPVINYFLKYKLGYLYWSHKSLKTKREISTRRWWHPCSGSGRYQWPFLLGVWTANPTHGLCWWMMGKNPMRRVLCWELWTLTGCLEPEVMKRFQKQPGGPRIKVHTSGDTW